MEVIEEIDRRLKRFKFNDKMLFLRNKMPKTKSLYFQEFDTEGKTAHLFESELLMFRSVIAGESNLIQKIDVKKYKNLVNIIREQKYIQDLIKKFTVRDGLALIGHLQFECQRSYYVIFYRMNYFFNFQNNKINMKTEFSEKFGCDYSEFELFARAHFLTSVAERTTANLSAVLIELNKKFPIVLGNILRTREGIISEYDKIKSNNPQFAIFDFNICRKYPLIFENNLIYRTSDFFVLYSCTISLLYRLTDENNTLNQMFAKEVLEDYVFNLVKNSKYYNDSIIISEFEYKKGALSPDVTIINTDGIVIMEVKKFSQNLKLRSLDPIVINSSIERLSEHMCQTFKKIRKIENGEINYKCNYDRRKVTGICLIYDDLFFEQEKIYLKSFEILKDSYESLEYSELTEKVIIMSLSNLENYLSTQNSGLDQIFKMRREDSRLLYDWSYLNDSNNCKHNGLPLVKKYEHKKNECSKRVVLSILKKE